ncbi:MAG: hypothetical protein AAGJ38_01040 [Planctomycetota bacterium]
MKAEIKDGRLILSLPLLDPPEPSRSGKTKIVASSRGVQKTTAQVDGRPVITNVVAYIKPPKGGLHGT